MRRPDNLDMPRIGRAIVDVHERIKGSWRLANRHEKVRHAALAEQLIEELRGLGWVIVEEVER